MTQIETNITTLYKKFMSELDIDSETGVLGKISNSRYANDKLRFSGFPYIGARYDSAKKKILFVGLDIGIDENRNTNNYHSIQSRRECVVNSPECSLKIDYNNHISGTYAMALYILKDLYGWQSHWDMIYSNKDNTFYSIVNRNAFTLPIEVLDYVALTNVHKFVTVCRGCNLAKENPPCKTEYCVQGKTKRSDGSNRRWYNEKEEVTFFLNEIEIFNPDVIYFQGSNIFSGEKLRELNQKYEIWIANHPSAWNVGANKSGYVDSERLRVLTVKSL